MISARTKSLRFQHTAARRRLAYFAMRFACSYLVSTHSRPKAAGKCRLMKIRKAGSFNTQPPEGGWKNDRSGKRTLRVSTHSRPKAAGVLLPFCRSCKTSFNTQPPEGGWNNL